MCWAIMISSNLEAREKLLAETSGTLAVRRLDVRQGSDRAVWMVTERGSCGCGLYCLEEDGSSHGPDWEQEIEQRRRRYRAKGWSEAKIERALRAAGHNRERAGQGAEHFTGLRPDVGVVMERAVSLDPAAELLVHMADGDYQDDIPMFERLRPTAITLHADQAWCPSVTPDTLYRLKVGR